MLSLVSIFVIAYLFADNKIQRRKSQELNGKINSLSKLIGIDKGTYKMAYVDGYNKCVDDYCEMDQGVICREVLKVTSQIEIDQYIEELFKSKSL